MIPPFPTPDEFRAMHDVKVGKRIAPAMQERLTLLLLVEQKLGGCTLTNAGELRLAQEKTTRSGAFPRAVFRRR